MDPNKIVSGEAKKPPYTPEFKKQLEDPKFSLPTNDLFLKYTGTTHTTLVKNWAGGGMMTTCNGFAGNCGKEMGAKDFLGQFELEAFLKKIGKGHAYIPATSGKRPGYGDIFRAVKFHMGVSLGCEGEDWLTVEAGQGGPNSTGYDAIKRKKQKYDASAVLGWCDMKLYLDPRPPVPDWLIGIWTIFCGNDTYIYRFNEYYEASFYLWKPLSNNIDGTPPNDTGIVQFQGSDSFTVTWSKEGGTERFQYDRAESFPGIMEKVTGTSSRGEQLKGVRA